MPAATPPGAVRPVAVSDPDRRLLELVATGLDRRALICATGWTAVDISQRLRTVRHALGARTDLHAVVLALRQGLID